MVADSMLPSGTQRRLTGLLKQLGVATLYALLIHMDHRYFESGTTVSSFEAASGFALAALLIGGKRYAWGVFLGAILINVTTAPFWAAVAISSAHTLEAFCGAWLLTRDIKFDQTIRSLRDYLRLILLGGGVGVSVGALTGVTALQVTGFLTSEIYSHELLHCWTGDVLGIALITPLMLVCWHTKNEWHGVKQVTEAALLLGLTFLAGQIIFLGWFHTTNDLFYQIAKGYWMFLFIAWVAVRLGTRGTVVAMNMTSVQALLGAYHGAGFFANDIAQTQLANYWFYMVTLSVAGMALATFLAGRNQSEKELQRFFNLVPDMVCIASTDGHFKKINRAWQTTLGYTEQEILATPFLDFIHPDDRDATMKEVERQLSGEATMQFINRYRCRDGSYRWLEWEATPAVDKTQLFASARDITERKKAEETVRASEARLQEIINMMPVALFIKDPASNIMLMNLACEEQWGMSFSDLRGTDASRFFPPEQMVLFLAKDREVFANRQLVDFEETAWNATLGENRIVHTYKKPVFDAAGSPLYLIGMSIDITERKQAEAEREITLRKVEQTQAMLQSVLDSTPDWIFAKDTNYRFLFVNRAFAASQGCTPQDMTGRPDTDFWPDELCLGDPARGIRGFHTDDDAAMAGEQIHNPNDPATFDDGKLHIFDTLKLPLRDAAGHCYGVLGYARDITERKQAEERHRTLIDAISSAGIMLFLVDDTYRVRYMNRPMIEAFGDAVGKICYEEVGGVESPCSYCRLSAIIGGSSKMVHYQPTTNDGRTLDIIAIPYVDTDGKNCKLEVIQDITERKAAEQQLGDLSAHMLDVREEEKASIAREIHDDLGGTLTALKMDAYWLSRKLPANEETAPLLERIASMSQLINNAVGVTRRVISDLRPTMLDDLGLLPALEWQCTQFHKRTSIECRIRCVEDEGELDKQRSIALFRIFQEAFTNVAQHSGASRVEVEFLHDEEKVVLSISDNGRGLSKERAIAAGSYGILGMTERAKQLGGTIKFGSSPNGGLSVTVILPLPADNKKGGTA